MATGKKYFWIKLKTDFMTSDKVDYLMSQTNGAEYVVLYQMLCMKCINTDGLLARQIGEVIIPFDAEKIARDCKYFSVDTVKQAFQLFIQLGMIYQETNGYLRIADFENMVGSETDWAAQKRKQVKSKENPAIECGESVESSVELFHTEIDIRDRVRDRNLNSKSCEKSQAKNLIDAWFTTYLEIYGSKPDACIPEENRKSFYASINKQLQTKLKTYDADTMLKTLNYAKNDTWVINNGFTIQLVFSDTEIQKALQNQPFNSGQQVKIQNNFNESLAGKIGKLRCN